jgi:hypothetical protein
LCCLNFIAKKGTQQSTLRYYKWLPIKQQGGGRKMARRG